MVELVNDVLEASGIQKVRYDSGVVNEPKYPLRNQVDQVLCALEFDGVYLKFQQQFLVIKTGIAAKYYKLQKHLTEFDALPP